MLSDLYSYSGIIIFFPSTNAHIFGAAMIIPHAISARMYMPAIKGELPG